MRLTKIRLFNDWIEIWQMSKGTSEISGIFIDFLNSPYGDEILTLLLGTAAEI